MPGRVLIVDDILPNIKLLEAKLTSEYYDVLSADNGPAAIRIAKAESPDLILLDVMMPEMDGFEVCERLKADPETYHIPVIMVTALSDTADRVRGLEAGADDFLSKPVRDTPLFARVRSLIRLKQLMDVWRVRESTSNRLGMAPTSVTSQQDITPGNILLVDDSAIDSVAISEALSVERHHLVRVDTIDKAMEAIGRQSFDLVLLALHIAAGDPLRLASLVRSHVDETVRAMPILLMAEDDGDMLQIAKALDLGVSDYVMKPVDRQELVARVRTQIRRRRYQSRLRAHYETSITLATTDALTGVPNRHYFDTHLEQLFSRAIETQKPLSIALCDADHFKRVNDTYGHAIGDEVLMELARRLGRNLRSLDLVARIGGEEFVVVMPDTPPGQALRISERLRSKVAEEPFLVGDGLRLPITTSIGVTSHGPDDAIATDLLKRADEAMYRAKRGGRNQVVGDFPTQIDADTADGDGA
jgi:two-component system cell cycle response regulator